MKRVRLIILTGLVIAALFAAVVPALAVPTQSRFRHPQYVILWVTRDGDNQPDKWNTKGDVVRGV